MRIFDRISNGWTIGNISLSIIKNNPSLLLFPIISGISMIIVFLSYFGGGLILLLGASLSSFSSLESLANSDLLADSVVYVIAFGFYLTNYFIVIFFNVALVHCAKRILNGKETSVGEGINFALTKVINILSWAILAATVGVILKIIQQRAGKFGEIISSILGVVWGIATFFVVPVLAYENVGPIDALKRSSDIIQNKWGESLGANFSFSIFTFLGLVATILAGMLLAVGIHPVAGLIAGILLFLLVLSTVSAAEVVFLAAAYEHVNERPSKLFQGKILDNMFVRR